MSIVEIAKFLQNFTLGFVFKILTVLMFILYAVFAFILIRQVELMGRTVKNPLTPFLMLLAFLHFIAAIAVLILAIILL